jgi:hypothetical protein
MFQNPFGVARKGAMNNKPEKCFKTLLVKKFIVHG